MATFDIEAARKTHTDTEIADFLHSKHFPDYDLPAAREAGVSDTDSAQFMATGQTFDRTPGSPVMANIGTLERGVATGAAGLLGIPQQISQAGIDAVGKGYNWLVDQPGIFGETGLNLPNIDISGSLMEKVLNPLPTSGDIRSGMNATGNLLSDIVGRPRSNVTYEGLDTLPPEQRPYGLMGEVGVQAAAPGGAVLGAGKAGLTSKLPILGKALESAARSPGRFAAGEASMAVGAGTGAGAMEAITPGNKATRLAGEVGGSVTHPTALMHRFGSGGLGRLLRAFTPAGKSANAARYMQRVFEETGEDPEEVLTALEMAANLELPEGAARGTVGQQTGSRTVLALEEHLANTSPTYSRETREGATAALSALETAADKLAATGDPAHLASAAILRGRAFDEFARLTLGNAEEKARTALVAIGRGGDPQLASKEAHAVLRTALDAGNKEVHAAWNLVPGNTPATALNLAAAVKQVRGQMTSVGKFAPEVEAELAAIFPKKAGGNNLVLTAKELNNFRSELLQLSREAKDANNYRAAHHYDTLANGVLADLAKIEGPEAAAARELTQRFHSTFTNTFANLGLRPQSVGGKTLTPEEMLYSAFGGGGVPNATQVNELRAAAAFPTNGADSAAAMESHLQQFVRSRSQEALTDPQTGRLRMGPAAAETRKPTLMEDFGGVRRDIQDAREAERRAQLVRTTPSTNTSERMPLTAAAAIPADSPFGQMLRGGDPVHAVTTALNSGDNRAYNRLANAAMRSGPDAKYGLMSATVESAMMRAGFHTDGGGSFARLHKALMQPTTSQQVPTLRLMVERGIMPAHQAERLEMIIERGRMIERGSGRGNLMDEVSLPPDALTDALIKMGGARAASAAGSRIPGPAGGSTLIIASEGAKLAKAKLLKGPNTSIMKSIMELTRNPELFAAAIRRMPDRRAVHRQLNGALVSAGLDPLFEDEQGPRRDLGTGEVLR